MPLITKLLKTATAAAATGAGAFAFYTRDSKFIPSPLDAAQVTQDALYKTMNPKGNPPLHDVCKKTIPLSSLRPELRDNEQELVRAFCRAHPG